MIEKLCGIYKIVCTTNNKIYIGSSLNIKKRWRYHVQDLKRGNHRNSHLQRAWNKYGSEMFKFLIIEIVPKSENLINREQYWLDTLESYNDSVGFNICKTAESHLGHRWTDEQKKRHSTRIKEICGPALVKANEANKKRYIEYGICNGAKLTKESVINLINDHNKELSAAELSIKYNISRTTISYIINRKLWSIFTKDLYIRKLKTTLTEEIVKDIKVKLKNGVAVANLSKLYNVSVHRIHAIKYNRTWSEVE